MEAAVSYLLQADVEAEARKICEERGIDPDKTYLEQLDGQRARLPKFDADSYVGDTLRLGTPGNPAFWGFMDEAAVRLRKRAIVSNAKARIARTTRRKRS